MALTVPACGAHAVAWRQQYRQGTKADRMLEEIQVCVPALISEESFLPPANLMKIVRAAQFEAIRFDQESVSRGLGISALLVQTESVASSMIEEIETDSINFLKATVGQKNSETGVAMAAGLDALKHVMANTTSQSPLNLNVFLDAHKKLMSSDVADSRYAGQIRDVYNWIGGSQFSPRNADYIPPAPDVLDTYLADLFIYVNRGDCEPLVQAAIAHAQFETLHPFTDGNGRIGRALISAMLKHHNLTTESVIPIACALVGARNSYINALETFRQGDAEPIVKLTALAVLCAAQTGREYLPELEVILDSWRYKAESRSGSAAIRILPLLLRTDTINVSQVARELEISVPAATEGISVLEARGILREITGRSRDRHWMAPDVVGMWSDYSAVVSSRFAQLV